MGHCVVPVEIHQDAFFEAEEKTEAIHCQREEAFRFGADEFDGFLRSHLIAFGVIEDGQQIQRGTKDEGAVSLRMIAEIQIVAHRSFDAGRFVMQKRVADDPRGDGQREGEGGEERAAFLFQREPNPQDGKCGKGKNDGTSEGGETEEEASE